MQESDRRPRRCELDAFQPGGGSIGFLRGSNERVHFSCPEPGPRAPSFRYITMLLGVGLFSELKKSEVKAMVVKVVLVLTSGEARRVRDFSGACEAAHAGQASSRPLSGGYEAIGKAGEVALGREMGWPVN